MSEPGFWGLKDEQDFKTGTIKKNHQNHMNHSLDK
jgi:hypothetical protein